MDTTKSTSSQDTAKNDSIFSETTEDGIKEDTRTNDSALKKLAPQYPERLFYKVLKAKLSHIYIDEWLNLYFLNKKEAVYELYQLYIDISSYQYISVKSFLDFHDLSELIPHMENTSTNTQKYFLIMRDKSSLNKLLKLDEFVERFIEVCAKQRIFNNVSFCDNLFKLFLLMANSSTRAIKHTGIYFALQHQSSLIRIKGKLVYTINSLQVSLETETVLNKIRDMQINIEKFTDCILLIDRMVIYLHDIFQKNWNSRDPKLHYIRMKCMTELYNWIEIFPDIYLNQENINIITESIIDPSAAVRANAVDIIGKLVVFHASLLPVAVSELILLIASQIKDTYYRISTISVDHLTKISKYYPIPSKVRKILYKNIYSAYYPLAVACGRYVIQSIHIKHGGNGDKKLLHCFLRFQKRTKKMGFERLHPFAIEAVFDYFPVLQNIQTYVEVLNDLKSEDLNIWINTLTESLYQIFTGKCSLSRNKTKKRKVNPKQVHDTIKELILSLKDIYNKCHFVKLAPLMTLVKRHMPSDISFDCLPQ